MYISLLAASKQHIGAVKWSTTLEDSCMGECGILFEAYIIQHSGTGAVENYIDVRVASSLLPCLLYAATPGTNSGLLPICPLCPPLDLNTANPPRLSFSDFKGLFESTYSKYET